jgi:drug/metabolite transporter (DMT)-like permease
MRRLRAGEWLAAAGGVALVVSLGNDWYGSRSAVSTFTVIDVLLALLAVLAMTLAVLQAAQDSPAKPVGAGVLVVTFGLVGVLLVLYRMIDEPNADAGSLSWGAYLGLASTLAITVGGWLSIANEHVPGLPPDREPELRPSPRIADRAQP